MCAFNDPDYISSILTEAQNEDGPLAKNEQCGIWTKTISGGQFMSPNYPNSYPPNKECVYVLEGK